jgi:hypothetical protein
MCQKRIDFGSEQTWKIVEYKFSFFQANRASETQRHTKVPILNQGETFDVEK